MKKTVLFMVLVMAFAQASSAQSRDGVGNSGNPMDNLENRIQAVATMPKGEQRGANIILIISELMGFIGENGKDLNSHFSGSAGQTYANAESIYRRYSSWTHPAVAAEVRTLRQSLNEYSVAVRGISTASAELKTSVGGLVTALAENGQKIKSEYASTPLGPLASGVLDWTTATVTGLNNYADLTASYGAKLQAVMETVDRNRDPGALISELSQIERQLQNFEPVQGHSFISIANVFKGYTQNIRSQYPGLN